MSLLWFGDEPNQLSGTALLLLLLLPALLPLQS